MTGFVVQGHKWFKTVFITPLAFIMFSFFAEYNHHQDKCHWGMFIDVMYTWNGIITNNLQVSISQWTSLRQW